MKAEVKKIIPIHSKMKKGYGIALQEAINAKLGYRLDYTLPQFQINNGQRLDRFYNTIITAGRYYARQGRAEVRLKTDTGSITLCTLEGNGVWTLN